MDSSSPSAPAPLVANGMDARIELAGGQLRIHRSGLMGLLITLLGHGDGLGEKTIPVQRLSSVEIVRTFVFGIFCFEYLRLSYPGGPESGGRPWRDIMLENVVVMGLFDNRAFYALKEAIEREMARSGPHDEGSPAQTPTAPAPAAIVTPELPARSAWPQRTGQWLAGIYAGVAARSGSGAGRWRRRGAFLALILGLFAAAVWLSSRGVDRREGTTAAETGFVDRLLFQLNVDGRRQVTWGSGDTLLYRATVRGRDLDAFVEANRLQAERLRDHVEREFRDRLAVELEPVFVDVDRRVSEYGEWVFNWWTSYILMVRGVGAIWHQLTSNGQQSFEQAVERVMADAIKERFIEIVLPPERFRPALQRAVVRATAGTARALQDACEDTRQRFLAVLATPGSTVERRLGDGTWVPGRDALERSAVAANCSTSGDMLERTIAELQTAVASTFGNTGAIDDVAIRITRPAVTTLVSAGLSASSLAAIATGIGIPAALVATPAMAAVLTKSAFTLVDLMLSELDEALNRVSFEAVVRDAVGRARLEFEQVSQKAVREAVNREIAVLQAEPLRLPRPAPASPGG